MAGKNFVVLAMAAVAAMVLIVGCSKSNAPTAAQNGSTVTFTPPNTSFARAAGITSGPITAEQAKTIAAAAAGGTAVSAEQEDENGVQVFGVIVQVGTTQKDVKVRISDGAVLKIEDGGPDGTPEGGGGEG